MIPGVRGLRMQEKIEGTLDEHNLKNLSSSHKSSNSSLTASHYVPAIRLLQAAIRWPLPRLALP